MWLLLLSFALFENLEKKFTCRNRIYPRHVHPLQLSSTSQFYLYLDENGKFEKMNVPHMLSRITPNLRVNGLTVDQTAH